MRESCCTALAEPRHLQLERRFSIDRVEQMLNWSWIKAQPRSGPKHLIRVPRWSGLLNLHTEYEDSYDPFAQPITLAGDGVPSIVQTRLPSWPDEWSDAASGFPGGREPREARGWSSGAASR